MTLRAGLAVLLWQGWLYFDSIAHMCALICAVIIGLVRSSALRSCPSQLSIAAASSARSAAARSASAARSLRLDRGPCLLTSRCA